MPAMDEHESVKTSLKGEFARLSTKVTIIQALDQVLDM